MTEEVPRVLFVDDEPLLLEGLERNLSDRFDITTATSGAEGLEILAKHTFDVISSDMRMPGMDGATFLAEARRRAPETPRILLTGYADVSAAIAAVNKGQIYRFLSKPCSADDIASVVTEASELGRLRRAERELLEKTVNGAIAMLTSVLEISAPTLFQRAAGVRRIVAHLAAAEELSDRWRVETAAMLAPVGAMTLPDELVAGVLSGRKLTPAELTAWHSHAAIGARLVAAVPRLHDVASLVERQFENVVDPPKDDLGRALMMLQLAQRFDALLSRGRSVTAAADELAASFRGPYGTHLLAITRDLPCHVERAPRAVFIADLHEGLITDEEVRASGGMVLLGRGTRLTFLQIERLRRLAASGGVRQPFRVIDPA